MGKITVHLDNHGTYAAPALLVDAMIAKHLPASPAKLRAIVEERSGLDYSDVQDASAFLVILADWYEAELLNGADDSYVRMVRQHH